MFAVEVYAAVRRFVFVEGQSRREAARVFGLSRETVGKMCRFSLPPGYTRTTPVEKPKLGALLPVIDAILEGDRTAPVKQRHTARRIFERLRDEHGFAGGYTVVNPPLGATVTVLPPGAVQTTVNGQVYFLANGLYYQPAMLNGVSVYTTVKL